MNGIITPVNKEISQQHCNELDALKLADSILAIIKEAGYENMVEGLTGRQLIDWYSDYERRAGGK